jgi:CRISPR system Cascade subunit CasA
VDLAIASGVSDDIKDKNRKGKRDTALREAFYALDNPFRLWLADIDPEQDDDVVAVSKMWRQKVKKILLRLGREMIDSAGQRAFVGKKNKNDVMNAPIAYLKFRFALAKALEL